MTIQEKLNNVLGYLTAMSFDKPELSNDLIEPLNTLSEAISEVENLSLSGVSQQRELLPDFLYKDDYGIKIGYHGDTEVSEEWNEYLEKLGNCG